MAAPFVQGRLRNQPLSVVIDTSCGHCDRPLRLRVDSELGHAVETPGVEPLLFHPQVDWATFDEPNIIHGF